MLTDLTFCHQSPLTLNSAIKMFTDFTFKLLQCIQRLCMLPILKCSQTHTHKLAVIKTHLPHLQSTEKWVNSEAVATPLLQSSVS